MRFKAGELLYPKKSYGIVGRCPLRQFDAKHYEWIAGDVPGIFIEYTEPQQFELNSVAAARVLMLIFVGGEPMLFQKGTWRRKKSLH